MELLLLPLLLPTIVPNFILVGLALYLFILGRRLLEEDWWTASALSALAAVEGAVATVRVAGLSLATYPYFDDTRTLVVDPRHEEFLVLLAFTLLVVVIPLLLRRWRRRAEPSRPVPSLWSQRLLHAFVIACLGGNWFFLSLSPWDPSASPVMAPDGLTEVRLVPYSAISDVNGHVLYRRKGQWAWRHCAQLGDQLTTCRRWTFTWNADSTEVVLDLGPEVHNGRSRFRMRGTTLVEGERDFLPDIATDPAQNTFRSRSNLLVAIDYDAGSSKNRLPWRLTVDAQGQIRWVVLQGANPVPQEMRLTAEQMEFLREQVRVSMTGPVETKECDWSGDSFVVMVQRGGDNKRLTYRAETQQASGALPQVQGLERLLHALLEWIPPPNPDQRRHLFSTRSGRPQAENQR